MLLISFSYFKDLRAGNVKNDDFAPILKDTCPLRPDYQNCMDMTYKNNVNKKFSPILKSTWPLGPDHEI